MEVIIIGTGGMAKELWGMLIDMSINVSGFVSEKPLVTDTYFCGLPVLGDDNWLLQERQLNLVIGNGNPHTRKKIAQKFENSSHRFSSFVHPGSHIFGQLFLRGGVVIMPGCVIQPNVKIGQFTYINMGVTIGHDVSIGKYCVVNHNAGISGNVHIGDEVLIGAGATIIENNNGGNGCTVGAGAVVTKNVPSNQTWVGIPAKQLIVKEKEK